MEDWNFFAYKTFDLVKIKTFAREQQLSARRHTDCDLCMTAVFGPCVSAHGHGGRGGEGETTSFPGLFPFSWGRSFPDRPHEEGKSPGNEVGGERQGPDSVST